MISLLSLRIVIAQTGEVISDPANERIVRFAVAGLVVLGVVVVAVTVWFWRSTKPEPVALAPLEAMSRRHFDRLSEEQQRARLEAVRDRGPGDAEATSGAPDTGDDTDMVGTPDQFIPERAPVDPLLRPQPPVP
jgi:hypothetical protein